MKKIMIALITVLLFGFNNITPIEANSAGGGGGNSEEIDQSEPEVKWTWSQWNKGAQGLKISVYKKDGTLIGTKAFINDQGEVDTLNRDGIMVKSGQTQRLSLVIEKGTWAKSGSGYFQYLDYEDYVNKSTYLKIVDLLNGTDEEELVEKLGVNSYNNAEKRDTVLVIEPATTFRHKESGKYYFGTYWEFMWMNDNLRDQFDFRWQFNSLFFNPDSDRNIFGKNLMIKKGEISAQTNTEIWDFLGTKFNAFKSQVTVRDSLGIAIITLDKVINIETDLECDTNINKGSCSADFSISEPKEEECVINNEIFKYQTITECGVVYCSQDISTDLDNFYKTFDPIIRTGGYFKMNPIGMDITKTCFLQQTNNSSSCNNWHTMIREEDAGTLKLSLASDYNLIKDSNTAIFTASCDRSSNGRCTKATVTQHIEYVLEPTTNRFISIKDMAGTATAPGFDTIDLGGPHLTTPINYANGEHQYTVDFTQTPLYHVMSRLVNETKASSNGNYVLNYSYSPPLNISDFSYSCPYVVENTNPDCTCTAQCCDNNCNPIECPNPEDEPGGYPNVIYRPVNLGEAFPGEDGTGRDYGSNWKGYVYDEAGNIIIKPDGTPYTKEEYYINNNRGYKDYDVYRAEPLYVIKLDYEAMKAIRQYNDATNHDYNDFTLTCDNGERCISNFLRGNVTGFNINLIQSGTCKDINSTIFDSCVARQGA
ncbi:MAG: hypothetical protein E7173_03985 [Firmicutes bacterium]|nr:hypothetical protein [Bacillota bacterium]